VRQSENNILDDPTSKYSTIGIRCRVTQSVERKTDLWEGSRFGSTRQHIFFSFQFYSFIASEAPTDNAANVNMLDLSVAMKFSSFSMNRKIWVYPVINKKKIITEQIGRPCTKFNYLNSILVLHDSFKK
jgi:hypothetical protein